MFDEGQVPHEEDREHKEEVGQIGHWGEHTSDDEIVWKHIVRTREGEREVETPATVDRYREDMEIQPGKIPIVYRVINNKGEFLGTARAIVYIDDIEPD